MSKSVKYPLQITDSLIEEAIQANLLCANYMLKGKFVCVEVTEDGYKLPHTASVIDDIDYANKACEVHNKYLGYTKEESDRIIYKSMQKALKVQ